MSVSLVMAVAVVWWDDVMKLHFSYCNLLYYKIWEGKYDKEGNVSLRERKEKSEQCNASSRYIQAKIKISVKWCVYLPCWGKKMVMLVS